MAKTADQQKQLDYLWYQLHEKEGRSAEAAAQAHALRQQYQDDPEMHGELAAIEMTTANAAAKQSTNFAQAYPYFQQATATVQETFPLGKTDAEALTRGNDLDPVYGSVNAQLEMLRHYYHLVKRLATVLNNPEFSTYVSALWRLLFDLSRELKDEGAALLLVIEHDVYEEAKQAFDRFRQQCGPDSQNFDPSRAITTGARLLNRALQEADYDTALQAFSLALAGLRHDRQQLTHFGKQIASNARAYQELALQEKLTGWQDATSDHDLQIFFDLLNLRFVGLGHDRTAEIKP